MKGELEPQVEGKQVFQQSVTKLRAVTRPRVSMYVKAMIVIVGALVALAI